MLRPAIALCFLLVCSFAAAQVPVPPLRSPVTDLTGTLDQQQIAAIEQRLRAFEQRKGSQIAVLIVPTTQPETVEQYSIRVAEAWKLGRKGVDDGVLLLVAKDDRAVRIEVGYGLEGALPDVFANRITDQVIVPRFRAGNFYAGISEAVDRIIAIIEGEPLPGPPARTEREAPAEGIGQSFPLLLMLLFVGSGLLRRTLGSFGGATATAGLAGILMWMLTGLVALAIVGAIVGFLFTLFSGGGGGGWTSGPRHRGRGWGGMGGGGWSGGGLGGGGWSGGGGGFGGGGASGRW